jgi:hypothetical protein
VRGGRARRAVAAYVVCAAWLPGLRRLSKLMFVQANPWVDMYLFDYGQQ